MTTNEQLGGLIEKTTPLLERATETTFFLHLLCFVLHLDICISTATRKPLGELTWRDLETLSPGLLFLTLVAYCLLMGFVFKFAYVAFLTVAVRVLPWALFPDRLLPPKEGWISLTDIRSHAHATKDYEIVRLFDEQQALYSRHRAAVSTLAELSFAAIGLLIANRYIANHGLLASLETLFAGHVTRDWLYLLCGLSVFLLGWFVWWDVGERPSAEGHYLYHPPLFQDLQKQRAEARERT